MDRRVWRWARSVRAHMVRAPSRGPFFGFGGKGGVRVESVVGDCTRSRVATYQETLLRPSLSYTADEVDLNEATHPHTQTRLTAHLTRRSSGNAPDGDRRRSLGQTSPLEYVGQGRPAMLQLYTPAVHQASYVALHLRRQHLTV